MLYAFNAVGDYSKLLFIGSNIRQYEHGGRAKDDLLLREV
jgi:hypothetical protein